MGIVSEILEKMHGKVHFYLYVGNSPAAEFILKDKEILVDIKNAVLAIELGLEQLLKGTKNESDMIKKLKASGYKIKIKYRIIEFEL